jgi:hypothetical protein
MNIVNQVLLYKNKRNCYINPLNNKFIFKGGSKYRIKINEIVDNEIIFKEVYTDGKRKLLLNKKKYFKNNTKYYDCVVIIINEKEKHASLDSLQISENNCIDLDDFGLKTTGKFHLKVAIKMLKKYKDKFNINKIILEDISTVKCNDEEFFLSSYLLLTKGYTFYGKEGFKYLKNNLNDLLKNYQEYTNNLKVKDVNINNILKPSKNIEINKKIIEMSNNNKNIKFIELLGIIFSRENMLNDDICKLYFEIQDTIINFYTNLLGADYIKIFMPNLKMELLI